MKYYDFSHDMIQRTSNEDLDNNMSYIRFLHSATSSPDVDIYINDRLTIPGLKYREFTDYINLKPGTYNIKVYPFNNTSDLLLDTNIKIDPKTITTASIYSKDKKLALFPLKETPLNIPTQGKPKIRIAHFIENIPPIDVYLSNGTLLYKNLNFKDLTKYIELPPNTYIIDIKLANTDISMLYVPNIHINKDNYYTLYLVGLLNNYPEPQMLIPLDGITYLDL